MRFAVRALTLPLLALAGAACVATPEEDATAPPGEVRPSGDRVPEDADFLTTEILYHAAASGVEDSRRVTVRADSTWQRIWRELHSGPDVPERPGVDFGRHVVHVATAGAKPTGGFEIDVEGVLANGDGVWVSVVKTEAGEGCVTTQARTAPAIAVKAPRREGPVKFVDRTQTRDC